MPQESPDMAAVEPPLPEGGMGSLAGSPMSPEEGDMMEEPMTSFDDLLSI
jgi:hypothetical protein